ncbi:MAG TPA: pitrilysin family protein [Vicinamibacterales bacterium]|jgi:zinc protease|nr:pitrilysin family protein [Vicinamibacterales bacterium]
MKLTARVLRLFAALGIMLASAACGGNKAEAPAPASNALPKIAFEKYTLPNGLEVILSEDKRLPMVSVNLWYHVGPANEAAGRTGFAHLFEHMMFQGSRHVPADTHFKFLESAGASEANGTTDFDRTNYFETLPSNQLELALWLESDRMGYLLDKLDAAELANQQDVVRNERRQSVENEPYGLAEEALVHDLFPEGHPYRADVMGSHADIQAAKLDDVKQFFKQYYVPNNASLAIVGDIDAGPTKALVEKYFGSLKRGAAVPPITVTTPPITSERRQTVKERVELPRVYMAWLSPAYFKPGDAAADMTSIILGGGKSSRLYKDLVYNKQIAQDVAASQQSLALGSMFQIQVTARPGHKPEELEQAVNDELDKIRTTAPEQAEVERARNTFESHLIEGLEKQGGFGGVADRLNTYNQYVGTPDYLAQDIERYESITPDSVRAFASASLQNNARVVVYAVPGDPDFGKSVPTPKGPAPKAGQGTESVNADEAWRNDPPKPGPARPLHLPTPETATLANGLTVMLNQRSGMPVVAADLVVRTGGAANPIDKPGLASFAAAMLDEATTTRNALKIADDTAQFGASLTTTSTMDASFVESEALKKNFTQTLDLLADVALHPTFPQEEIDRQRASRSAELLQLRADPSQLSSIIMAAALYGPNHPYGFPSIGTEASLKIMSRDDMQNFWKAAFVPNNAALVVAGDISMAELKPMVEKAFSAWQKGTVAIQTLNPPVTTASRVIVVDAPHAPQTALRVAEIGAARSNPDFNAIEVMNMGLGGLFSSRINLNLREDHGYTYGANSQFVFRRTPGPFAIGGMFRSDATAQSVSEIFKEVRGMATKPLSGDELQMAKDSLARSVPANFETSDSAAGTLAEIYIYDLGADYFSHYADRTEAVTAEQAAEAAKKYVQPDKLIVVAVGDRQLIAPALATLNLGPMEVWTAEGKPQKIR